MLRRLARASCDPGAWTELRRDARSADARPLGHSELAERSRRLRLALEALRSVEPGPDYEKRLDEAERQLLALLLASPSMSPNPGA